MEAAEAKELIDEKEEMIQKLRFQCDALSEAQSLISFPTVSGRLHALSPTTGKSHDALCGCLQEHASQHIEEGGTGIGEGLSDLNPELYVRSASL